MLWTPEPCLGVLPLAKGGHKISPGSTAVGVALHREQGVQFYAAIWRPAAKPSGHRSRPVLLKKVTVCKEEVYAALLRREGVALKGCCHLGYHCRMSKALPLFMSMPLCQGAV